MVEAIDDAITLIDHKKDAAWLRRAVSESCNKLAAELSSAHVDGNAVADLIGMPFITEAGPDTMAFASANLPSAWFLKLTETFTLNPLGAYRAALLYRIALRADLEGGIEEGTKCGDINPTDAANITAARPVRVMMPLHRGAMELTFGLDRGAYRVIGGDLALAPLEAYEQRKRAMQRTSAAQPRGAR